MMEMAAGVKENPVAARLFLARPALCRTPRAGCRRRNLGPARKPCLNAPSRSAMSRFASTAGDALAHRSCDRGEVAEWLKAPHSKCGIRATVSGVRIPPSPPSSRSRQARFAQRLRWGGLRPVAPPRSLLRVRTDVQTTPVAVDPAASLRLAADGASHRPSLLAEARAGHGPEAAGRASQGLKTKPGPIAASAGIGGRSANRAGWSCITLTMCFGSKCLLTSKVERRKPSRCRRSSASCMAR